jgi:hypothetical protein
LLELSEFWLIEKIFVVGLMFLSRQGSLPWQKKEFKFLIFTFIKFLYGNLTSDVMILIFTVVKIFCAFLVNIY